MSKKAKRALNLLGILGIAFIMTILILFTFSDSVSFFYSPTEILNSKSCDKEVRLGGMVESIVKNENHTRFIIKDSKNFIEVLYNGSSPSLMKDGIEVVVAGKFIDNKFIANQVLIKHDERYYPRRNS